MLDVDLYALKRGIERVNETLDLARASAAPSFLRHARRAFFPLPLVDRPEPPPQTVFPAFRSRPATALEGKRVAVIASGGGGGCVALCGVARAFEEAGIEPALLCGCSGGAIWGSMWAGGLTAAQMAGFSLSWQPTDYLDVQWSHFPRYALSALKGFTGLAKGEAIEHLFDERMRAMRVADTRFPITTIVYNMDLGRVDYFGSEQTPDLTIGRLVRTAIALPLFIESVEFDGHLYVDGGIIELIPAQPVLADGGFDHVFAVNFMLPHGLQGRDITGWGSATAGILEASRQLQQGYHLEFARRVQAQLGDRFTLIDPIDYSLLRGVSFYDLFIDRTSWPQLMRSGYRAAQRALDPFREARAEPADQSRPVAAE